MIEKLRVGKRSLSWKWKCTDCHKQFYTPTSTDKILKRRCLCAVHSFGPERGNGKYKSTTVLTQSTMLPI